MSLNDWLPIGALICGLVIGHMSAAVYYCRRHLKMYKKIQDMHRVIEALLDQINKMARKPINLDGDQNAYRQNREQV